MSEARELIGDSHPPGNNLGNDLNEPASNDQEINLIPVELRPSCRNGKSLTPRFSTLFHRTTDLLVADMPALGALHRLATNAHQTKKRLDARRELKGYSSRFQTMFLVDDSESMSKNDIWSEATTALSTFILQAIRYKFTIDIYFLNTDSHLSSIREVHEVETLFRTVQPTGKSISIGLRVQHLLTQYLDRLEYGKVHGLKPLKPLNLVILTDGVADDTDILDSSILHAAQRLNDGQFPIDQVGIHFIQIGRERYAMTIFNKLDLETKARCAKKRDIVNTVLYRGRINGDFLWRSILNGLKKPMEREYIYI